MPRPYYFTTPKFRIDVAPALMEPKSFKDRETGRESPPRFYVKALWRPNELDSSELELWNLFLAGLEEVAQDDLHLAEARHADRFPLKKNAERYDEETAFARLSCKNPPKLYLPDISELERKDDPEGKEFYAGRWARARVRLYGFEANDGTKILGIELRSIQALEHGDRLYGGEPDPEPESGFSKVTDVGTPPPDEAPQETASGDGNGTPSGSDDAYAREAFAGRSGDAWGSAEPIAPASSGVDTSDDEDDVPF